MDVHVSWSMIAVIFKIIDWHARTYLIQVFPFPLLYQLTPFIFFFDLVINDFFPLLIALTKCYRSCQYLREKKNSPKQSAHRQIHLLTFCESLKFAEK